MEFAARATIALAMAATAGAAYAAKPTIAVYYFPNWGPEPQSEWTLIKAAQPRFEGHEQPKVPLWGYQNERDPAVMAQKLEAAAEHGVDVFLFDWYWFDEGPYLDAALEKGYLGAENNDRVQFAIHWCNHDVGPMAGAVQPETFEKLTDHVVDRYFSHSSYWTIDGKPVFSIYQLNTLIASFGGIDETAEALERFREKARQAGLPGIHINAVLYGVMGEEPQAVLERIGVDSLTSYVWIHHHVLPAFPASDYGTARDRYFDMLLDGGGYNGLEEPVTRFDPPYWPVVTMGWDASPRTPQDQPWTEDKPYPFGPVMVDNTPKAFHRALEMAETALEVTAPSQEVIVINAWNEWGEGSYIEPDRKTGYGYLEAIREFKKEAASE